MIRSFVKYFSLSISSSSILFGGCIFLKRLGNFDNSFPSSDRIINRDWHSIYRTNNHINISLYM